MKKSFQKNNLILWTYAILISIVLILIPLKTIFLPYATAILAILIPIFTFLINKGNALAEKIDGVKPVWKFSSVDSEIEYFSLDRSKSFVDNVRYYSLIVDDKHNIQSINKLNKSVMPSVKDKSNLNKNDELRQFYFSDNAIAKSEEIYQLNLSPFFNEDNTQSKPQAKPIFISEDTSSKKLNIIKATTIYGDDTYFFEGDGLSGGITKINGKYKPYSGNWKHKDIKRATNYLDQLEEKKDKNDKQDKRETNINDVLLKQLNVKDQQISKLQKSLDQQQLQLAALAENRQLINHIQELSGLIESSNSTQKRQATKKKDNFPNNDNPSHIKDKKDRMKKLKKATPEADSYITKTTTIKQPKNE